VSLVFCADRRALDRRRRQLWTLAFPGRSVWVCWPKKSSHDVKVCAIDEDWSGLKADGAQGAPGLGANFTR
jgi:hypothetical protein